MRPKIKLPAARARRHFRIIQLRPDTEAACTVRALGIFLAPQSCAPRCPAVGLAFDVRKRCRNAISLASGNRRQPRDTGHFNAVEFNICFNQLAYVVFGKCVEAGLLQRIWPASVDHIASFAEYKKHQLPAMLIVRVDGVRFFKPMKSDDFRAELSIDRMTMLGQAGFFYTTITFSDCEGVKAKGYVVLACQPNLTR